MTSNNLFRETRQYLAKLGLPSGDAWKLPSSKKKFPDGAHFRIEVPTVNSVEAYTALLESAKDEFGVRINRVDQTAGIIRYSNKDLETYIEMAKEWKIELYVMAGVRATYDTGAQVYQKAAQAKTICYRLRGMEQIVRAIEDFKRALEMGVRGLIVCDEGLLYILNKMREDEEIPKNTKFKASATLGYCNPVGLKILESLGADSANPVRDLQLPMIAALRQAVNIPIDLHNDNPPASGGFIRTYETPEIIRVAAPVYVKTGNILVAEHGMAPQAMGAKEGRLMAGQASIVDMTIKKYFPDAKQSKNTSMYLAIPE